MAETEKPEPAKPEPKYVRHNGKHYKLIKIEEKNYGPDAYMVARLTKMGERPNGKRYMNPDEDDTIGFRYFDSQTGSDIIEGMELAWEDGYKAAVFAVGLDLAKRLKPFIGATFDLSEILHKKGFEE